ncbi:hypothetical protein O9993_21030 [Vibrio lentus]|nr:hypothetical protein [Vibrio lentus]
MDREEELTVVQVEKLIQQRIRRVEQPGYEPKKRDAYIEKLTLNRLTKTVRVVRTTQTKKNRSSKR